MMGPDYTHWHGTYEVAKKLYSEYIPELRELADHNLHADDPAKKQAAEQLTALIEETLNGQNHLWYLNKMSDAEKARRARNSIPWGPPVPGACRTAGEVCPGNAIRCNADLPVRRRARREC